MVDFDVMKLCDFFDRYHPSYLSVNVPAEEIGALLDLFGGSKNIAYSQVNEEILSLPICLLRFNGEEKKRILKTLTGQSEIVLASDDEIEETILHYLAVYPDRLSSLKEIIPSCAFYKFPASFLLKFIQRFEVKDRSALTLALQINDYQSDLYETLSSYKLHEIAHLLRSEPKKLSASQIEAAIMMLPDLELLYNTISGSETDADFTSFHLLLLLIANNCSQDLKLKFSLLPIKIVELSGIRISSNYHFGSEFVDPLMQAIESNPAEELLQFCSFDEFSFIDLLLLRKFKLFALKLHALLLLGEDEIPDITLESLPMVAQYWSVSLFICSGNISHLSFGHSWRRIVKI